MKLTSWVLSLCVLFFVAPCAFGQSSVPAVSVVNQHRAELIAVYGETWVNGNPGMVQALEECRSTRISFQQLPLGPDEKYPLLSSFALMTKMNPKLEPVNFSQFDLNTFNPFVYNIEFLSCNTQVIRIDSTDWIMVIEAVKR